MKSVRLHEYTPDLPTLRVRAVIDTQALAENFVALMEPVQRVSPKTYGIAVVKADAYGHGIRPCVEALLRVGCHSFAVACPAEAVALRRLLRELGAEDATDILVLGYASPEEVALLAEHAVTATLLSDAHARALLGAAREAGVTLRVHAALDTGMNRIGYPSHTEGEQAATVEALCALFGEGGEAEGGLLLDGLFTHFARSDEDYDTEMAEGSLTMRQYARYRRVLDGLTERGIRPRVCHVCNSAAAVRFPQVLPEGCMDAVRLGINLYGYGVDLPAFAGSTPTLTHTRPVMRLGSAVAHVHTLLPGESVGYGGDYAADTPRTVATLPLGYADGWLRAFTGTEVTFHTESGDYTAPIVGRICMDQCMADVTGLPVTVGTPVTLFGRDSRELESLAERAHTISYEILCLVTARVPRVYR